MNYIQITKPAGPNFYNLKDFSKSFFSVLTCTSQEQSLSLRVCYLIAFFQNAYRTVLLIGFGMFGGTCVTK